MNEKELIASIKAGTLEFNNDNLKLVQDAWCKSVIWDDVFKRCGLDSLPDPEGLCNPQVFEDWMVEAFIPEYGAEETRRRLHWARDEIVKDARRQEEENENRV